MRLRLQHPPTVEFAPRHAQTAVDNAIEISGVDLDYSPASLQALDDIIEEMRQDGVTTDQMAETLFTFGCYLGEVFVRNADGKWRDTHQTSMKDLAGFPLVVELGENSYCNPIGKVFKRLENGMEDYLPYFYQVFTQGPPPTGARSTPTTPPAPAASRTARPWWKFW